METNKLNLMKTGHQSEAALTIFLQTVSAAVTQLKQRLQQDYEQVYPGLGEIIRLILDEEETTAWELSLFPHLFLPDLVEAHVAKLGLQPAPKKHDEVGFRIVSSRCQATNQLSLMWIVNSARGRLYTVFKNPTTKGITMKTKKLVEKVAAVPSESKGICAAIARLTRRPSVIDIVERFQTKRAQQEERETKNFHPPTNGAIAPGIIRLTE